MSVTYNVYRNGTLIANNITSKTYFDTGLSSDTEYEYRVSKVSPNGETPLSTILRVKTLPDTPTPIIPTGITSDKNSVTVDIGDTDTVTVTVLPSGASQEVEMTYSGQSIATVTKNKNIFTITGISQGNANLTISSKDKPSIAKVIPITVTTPIVNVKSVSLNKSSASIEVTSTVQLTATVLPTTATNKNVTYSSSNDSIATVELNGLVTGISTGNATITATTEDGNFTDTCDVTVSTQKISVDNVAFDMDKGHVMVGEDTQLTVTIQPSNATNKQVTFTSDDPTIATVDSTGLVTGIKNGKTVINVTTVDGNKTSSCPVNVNIKEDSEGLYSYIYARDNILIDYQNDTLYLSEDNGDTFDKALDVTGIHPIKYVHMFTDGTLMFCNHTKVYTSSNFVTYEESSILDKAGNPLVLTYNSSLQAYNNPQHKMFVDGVEMLVWGNYNTDLVSQGENIRVWYTIDKGKTVKALHEFGSWEARHVHNVAFNPTDSSFWIMTGDAGEQNHLLKGTYDMSKDTWTLEEIGRGEDYKFTNMVFLDGYIYYAHDIARGGVRKCRYEDIGDVSKHEKLFSTNNDTHDLIMSERGEFIVLQTVYGGTDDGNLFYYSPDRVNFYNMTGKFPAHVNLGVYYSVRFPDNKGRVLAGIVGFEGGTNEEIQDLLNGWSLKPSTFLEETMKKSGFPHAFKPLSEGDIDIIPPKVTLLPDKDTYEPTDLITLQSDKPCTIYYTLNDAEPTANSKVYTEPIPANSITGDYLKYIAVSENGTTLPTVLKRVLVVDSSVELVTDGLVSNWTTKEGINGNLWANTSPNTIGKYDGVLNGATVDGSGLKFDSTKTATLPVPVEVMASDQDATLQFKLNMPSFATAEILSFETALGLYINNYVLLFDVISAEKGIGTSAQFLYTDREYNITITRIASDGRVKMFIDGLPDEQSFTYGGLAVGVSMFAGDEIFIGKGFMSQENLVGGHIDNVRIYNKILSNDEIYNNHLYDLK